MTDDQVGSVGDEAAKLLGAVMAMAGQAAESARGVNDHIATGAAECQLCPVCRTVHAVRKASPEVRAQLATAASSFLQAAAALVAASASPAEPTRPSSVQHIDLDDESDGAT